MIITIFLFFITNYYTNYITNVRAISARPAPASQPKTVTPLAICIGNKLSFVIIFFFNDYKACCADAMAVRSDLKSVSFH